jgi:ABC-type transport system involved in multi-copper enzyme maturation permease subunit
MPIFDQGYQHWRGPLSGHPWRWLTIARQGIRVQMAGRLQRALLIVAWVPPLALVVFMALWGLIETKSETMLALVRPLLPPDLLLDPRAYRVTVWTLAYSFFFKFEMFFIMLLVAVVGPGLISRDLRFNSLPLYFSRPLNRFDYFLGKLGVVGALVASVALVPAVFAYFVGLCFSLDPSVLKDTWPVLAACVGYGLVVTASAGTLMLALSSLTRRSLYVGIAWAGLWIISGAVGSSLTEIHRESAAEGIYREEMERWVSANPPPEGVRVPRVYGLPHGRPGRRPKPFAVARFGRGGDNDPWVDAWWQASDRAGAQARADAAAELRRDWRPLCSYVGNLERLADQMLGTDAAWVTISQSVARARSIAVDEDESDPGGDRALADQMVPQYPWQWSAGVLAGLLGLSSWTLTRRVKSLDNLK